MLKRSRIVNDPHKYLVLFTYLLLGLCPTFMIRVFGDLHSVAAATSPVGLALRHDLPRSFLINTCVHFHT